jgi:MYXO-CTERM domain-containing protein
MKPMMNGGKSGGCQLGGTAPTGPVAMALLLLALALRRRVRS